MSINLCNISVNNFSNICRTCSQTNDLISIHQNTYLIGMLSTVTHVQIHLYDDLPKKICLNCVKDLNKCYSFISKCKATDVALRQRLTKQKMLDLKEKEESIKPKMTEEIFIKTEITDLDEYNDPLSDEGTKDPLEHQENTSKEFEDKFDEEETNEDRLSNDCQSAKEEETPKRKRKRGANSSTKKNTTKNESEKQTNSANETNNKSTTENGRNLRKKRPKTELSDSTKNAENTANCPQVHEPLVVLKIGRRTKID